MLLGYLENLALDSLDGKGIAYVIDMRLIIKYIIAVFVIHFIIYITIKRRKFVPKEYFAKAFFAFYFVILMSFTLLPIEFPGINEQNAVFNFSLKPILLMFLSRAQLINIAGNVILFAINFCSFIVCIVFVGKSVHKEKVVLWKSKRFKGNR